MQVLERTNVELKKRYRLERDIENRSIFLIRQRWPDVQHRKMNGYGFRAWPDRLFLFRNGVSVYIEFKRPGEALSKGQAYTCDLLRQMGHTVCRVDDPQQAVVFCEAAIENAKAKRRRA